MNLNDFVENWQDMTTDAVAAKFKKALSVLATEIDQAPQLAADLIEGGFFNDLLDLEADDTFGTEGMRL